MEPNFFVHPTAIVEKNVQIGERSRVWHHCHVRENSKLGEDVSLGKDVFIDQGVVIGRGSRIQNGVSVYQGVKIQDWVFVGPSVTFTNDRHPRAGNKNWKIAQTILEGGCSIGAGSIIVCDVRIGTFAMVGAASVVTEDIPPFHLVYGLPAKIISKICACGMTKLDLQTEPSKYIQPCCEKNLRHEVLFLARNRIGQLSS